ncbi:hypothetical protein AB0L70_40595 [Kribbella sp. NPDC051952]|uniref:hypothetical protein n=1 Tax=Kribbella sp. NPDC051952 TaxID=3154851 RepID=UPI003416E596
MFHRRRPHAARYYAGGVFYTFSFSLPLGTNIHMLADRFLSSGLATAAGVAGSDRALLGKHYSKPLQARKLSEDIISLKEVCDTKSSLWTWIRQHPASTFRLRRRMVRAIWKRDRMEIVKNLDIDALRAVNDEVDLEAFKITELIGGMARSTGSSTRQCISAASLSSDSTSSRSTLTARNFMTPRYRPSFFCIGQVPRY